MKARRKSISLGAVGTGIASTVVLLIASPAFATFAEPLNTVTGYNHWPAQTTCTQFNEYGEFIYTEYSKEDIISNNGCIAGIVQDVYYIGTKVYNGSFAGGSATDYWYQATDPQNAFGANLGVQYYTRDYGPVTLYYSVSPWG